MNRREFMIATAAAGLAAPARDELPFWRAHLDFHTSELINNVGADFDRRKFAPTLKAARANSINVFAKSHNGYAYYDSKIAARHPALQIDMLGQMLHYPMTRRAPDIDIIEEPGILLDQELRVRVEAAPKRMMLAPQNKPLPFRFESGYAVCRLEKVIGHQAISVEL